MEDLIKLIVLFIGSGGFLSIVMLIWNSSKKQTKLADKVDNNGETIERLEKKIDSHIFDSKLAEQKLSDLSTQVAVNSSLLKRHDDDIAILRHDKSGFKNSAV